MSNPTIEQRLCPRCLSAWIDWINYLGSREWECHKCGHRWEEA